MYSHWGATTHSQAHTPDTSASGYEGSLAGLQTSASAASGGYSARLRSSYSVSGALGKHEFGVSSAMRRDPDTGTSAGTSSNSGGNSFRLRTAIATPTSIAPTRTTASSDAITCASRARRHLKRWERSSDGGAAWRRCRWKAFTRPRTGPRDETQRAFRYAKAPQGTTRLDQAKQSSRPRPKSAHP